MAEQVEAQQQADATNDRLSAAASRIQEAWRLHISRSDNLHRSRAASGPSEPLRQDGMNSNASAAEIRWTNALTHAQAKQGLLAAEDGRNDPTSRWRRTVHIATRIKGDDGASRATESPEVEMETKGLETQHWLELTDGKHRYGSNLKYYHRKWLEEDTVDNFFKWLDRGAGKELSLEECPRTVLEAERIVYLSPEQRRNYLVKIDEKGLLRWIKNNEYVDTTAGRWQDAGEEKGIEPWDSASSSATPASPILQRRQSFSSGDASEDVGSGPQHYTATEKQSNNKLIKALRQHFTMGGLTEKLLRQTVKKNTWIYVADKHLNIYVGIKHSGAFQHSSFLGGGSVVSAGLLEVHNGLITKLSPLSGHYRTEIKSFKKFVAGLETRGADLHKVQITKAEMALWGMQKIKQIKTDQREVSGALKTRLGSGLEKAHAAFAPKHGNDDREGYHWKRDILIGRRHSVSSKDRKEPT